LSSASAALACAFVGRMGRQCSGKMEGRMSCQRNGWNFLPGALEGTKAAERVLLVMLRSRYL